jgi:hypothetical protein
MLLGLVPVAIDSMNKAPILDRTFPQYAACTEAPTRATKITKPTGSNLSS